MTMEYARKQEEEIVVKLNKLIALAETLNIQTRSRLDPLVNIRNAANNFRRQVYYLLEKYKIFFQVMSTYDNESALIDYWLFSIGANTIVASILKESVHLILDRNLKTFREGMNSNFTTYVLDFYSHLFYYKELLSGDHEEQLDKTIVNFENYFKKVYMIENNGITKYDEVRDILSTNNGAVASLEIRNEDIIRKGFFRMVMNTLHKYTILVEIAYLKNNSIAVFKVNSNELPTTIGSPRQFLQRLVQGEYQLLHLGKALLFAVIRQYDLQIIKELPNGAELKTKTSNGVELKLTSVDPIEWDTYWRLYFQKLYNSNSIKNVRSRNDMDKTIRKASASSLNFIEKYEKLNTNPFIDNDADKESIIGLGIELESSKEATPVEDSPENKISRNNSGFSLHKSNPLGNLQERSRAQISSTNPFKEFLMSDNCVRKVSELENLATTLENTVSLTGNRDSNTIKKLVINDLQIKDDTNNGHTKSFRLPNENTTLDRQSELADKPNSEVKDYKGLTNTDNLTTEDTDDYVTKDKTKPFENGATENDIFTQYINKFTDTNSLPIFEESDMKISFWTGTGWESPMTNIRMKLTVIVVQGKRPMILYHNADDMYVSAFALLLTSRCKVGKATAQDIQINFPKSSLCHGSVKGSSVINIRIALADRLLLILQNCILENPAELAHNDSPHIGDYSKIADKSDQIPASQQSLILLSNMKSKLHTLKSDRWYPTSIGRLMITTEILENRQILRFDYIDSSNNQTNIITDNWKLQRLGNTGIALIQSNNGILFEFVNKNVTNEVWKLLERYSISPSN
ncbi:hypothetical protein C6P45_001926 [Maudiozyma exigua]|uniref:Uncharacterized protein n=1 Tax=Maudiozyma exigua TaxID=34358 RepID=A0A9P7BCJ4_MAUEX|nr:hypothetical protein C6P45_001926 [Kazachstania exigua]